jgi:hypothetical protein
LRHVQLCASSLEYDVLATALKVVLERDDSAFDAAKLEAVTAETLRGWLGDNDLPMMVRGCVCGSLDVGYISLCPPFTLRGIAILSLFGCQEERVAKVREVGAVLRARFGGLAANLIASANGSAVALVDAVTAHFPGGVGHPHIRNCTEVARIALWRFLLPRCAVCALRSELCTNKATPNGAARGILLSWQAFETTACTMVVKCFSTSEPR